jgi:hypothetical protein
MRGLLIKTYAGCKILQDSYNDEHRYRVVTVIGERCILETGKIDEAEECAERFSKLWMGVE